jgi:hypothetical protein
MDFVSHSDVFDFSGDWVFHETGCGMFVVGVGRVDVVPVSFEGVPFLFDLFVDIGLLGRSYW